MIVKKNKKRICVVTSNRADYVKLKPVMEKLHKNDDAELLTVVTGSHLLKNFDNTINLIKQDGFPVSHSIHIEVDGRLPVTMAKSTGLGVIEFSTAFYNLNPDIVILHGDRFEALAAAVAASMMNIFIVHIEGGEITGTIDEHSRHAITKLSHCHFVATKKAYENIIKMGEDPSRVKYVGCPGIDLLLKTEKIPVVKLEKLINSNYVKEKILIDLKEGFILCVYHPVTTEFENNAKQMEEILSALLRLKKRIILLWPNIDAGADEISQVIRIFKLKPEGKYISTIRNFPSEIYFNLLRHASALVGNSSSGIREAGYLGTPVVNIGSRQKGREHGKNVINLNCNAEEIFDAVKTQLKNGKYKPEFLYGNGDASDKIHEILKGLSLDDLKNIQKRLAY